MDGAAWACQGSRQRCLPLWLRNWGSVLRFSGQDGVGTVPRPPRLGLISGPSRHSSLHGAERGWGGSQRDGERKGCKLLSPAPQPPYLCEYHWSRLGGGRLFMNRFTESDLLLGAEAAVVNSHHK